MQAVAVAAESPLLRPPTAPRRRLRLSVIGLCLGGVLALACQAYYITLGQNLHEVVPGQIYRSAHLKAGEWAKVVRQYHIRTVLNLRGCCPETPWYQQETDALRELGVKKYDIAFSSYVWPSVAEFQMLVDVLRDCEYPILMHCRRGADRTGMASAAALLLHTDIDLPQAREQLSWRYGHVAFSKTNVQDQVFELYANWLTEHHERHTPERFYRWVMEDYRPGQCWADIEALEMPSRLPADRPSAARFRVRNTSLLPWHFKQSANSGVHLHFALREIDGEHCATGGSGYFEEVVAPGQTIDLTLCLPAMHKPGRYELIVDMSDEQCCWFSLVGSFPLIKELEVGDAQTK